MEFEYDPAKSSANLDKHGIDFDDAQALWDDPLHVVIPARTLGEVRWLIVGRITERHWSAIITHRQQRVRIISVRRARPEEVAIYERDEY
jgi:hypothetical protein